jgi:hypothetical protein
MKVIKSRKGDRYILVPAGAENIAKYPIRSESWKLLLLSMTASVDFCRYDRPLARPAHNPPVYLIHSGFT